MNVSMYFVYKSTAHYPHRSTDFMSGIGSI